MSINSNLGQFIEISTEIKEQEHYIPEKRGEIYEKSLKTPKVRTNSLLIQVVEEYDKVIHRQIQEFIPLIF